MKRKVLIKLCMYDGKSRSRAMKIAVGLSGVESATIKGDYKNLIEVTGDGIDAADLTTSLRKKFADAELLSVEDVKPDPEKPKPPDPKPSPPEPPQPVIVHSPICGTVLLREHDPYYDNSPCSIM